MIYSQSVLYSCDAARETIEKDMEICVFYSWQSKYYENCGKIIEKALEKVVKELNKEQSDFHYEIERGGGDVLGAEHIDNNIDKIINTKADIAIVDFTHNGIIPQQDPKTGEWKKEKCSPNTNAVYENGKLEYSLGERQVLKVYNIAYGNLKTNLEMPFDLRQEHFPIPFFCDDSTSAEERVAICDDLKRSMKELIIDCTKSCLDRLNVRYSPLIPMRIELSKKLYQTYFKATEAFEVISKKIKEGQSFRLLGLPGLGKTRMVGEALKGRDIDVYYCDCREQPIKDVMEAIDKLMIHGGVKKQTVVLDNCSQKLCGYVNDAVNENGYNCQLLTIHYDPKENVDSGTDSYIVKVQNNKDVVKSMVDAVLDMPEAIKETIISLSGGFPMMASLMIENYQKGDSIANVSKSDLFNRMLGINPENASDQEKLKVLTAFSIFKFIGLYGMQEKQGRFIAGNKIITNIRGAEDDNLQLFKEVHGLYQKAEILERQGNLVLMRLIPLAIYLCKSWFDKQTSDSISDLIKQIRSCEDEGTKNMLIESLSKRITLLSEVPLAKELNDGLTDPTNSPFLKEEVVLDKLGSRLFLAFSEVNPESCGEAIFNIIWTKTDDELLKVDRETRRNLAWALDHLAFDNRSFRYSMLTLARFSLVETEGHLSNNTTGLFVERFPVLLPATETPLMERIEILKELSADERYRNLIIKALLMALNINHDYRSGGAEKQGLKSLTDYVPKTYDEIFEYYSLCLDMLLANVQGEEDFDNICKTVAQCARGYYLRGVENFLLHALEVLVPKKNYVWEEMRDSLTYIVKYDGKKRGNLRVDEIEVWRKRLTKDDYVYRLEHASRRLDMEYDLSFDKEMELIAQSYEELAKELIDHHLYEDDKLLAAVMRSKTLYLNRYGITLSEYAKEKGIQEELLWKLLAIVLNGDASKDGESLFYYYFWKVDNKVLTEWVYDEILKSQKKYLFTAIYALKGEGEEKLAQLFELLDKGEITVDDFGKYYTYMPFVEFNVKYVSKKLLDYGNKGATMVISRCRHLLYDEAPQDKDYQEIARSLLLKLDLGGAMLDVLQYMDCVTKYFERNRDEELAFHIQDIVEEALKDIGTRDNYYLGRLYRKVFSSYKDQLKHRVFKMMEAKETSVHWVDLMRTSYPQEKGEDDSIYTIIPNEEWFEWLENGGDTEEKAFTLAMMFKYSVGSGKANPVMVRLLDKYYSETVICGVSARFHSFGWTGSGIPLYRNRIAICKDYVAKLQNEDARQWFLKDISMWEEHIQEELLQNAHEKAIYDDY